jgi:hypothetical protein
MSFLPLHQRSANHPVAADILELHLLPGAVELVRLWKVGLANLTRGPPKNNPATNPVATTPRKPISGLTTKLTQVLEPQTTFTQEV